jgi:hypothetical protein
VTLNTLTDVEYGFYEQRRWTELPSTYVERALSRELFGGGEPLLATGSNLPVLRVEVRAFEEVLAPAHPTSIAWHATHAEVGFEEGEMIRARLVVGADGIRSGARSEAGIDVEPRSYAQSGVVANFATDRPHADARSSGCR